MFLQPKNVYVKVYSLVSHESRIFGLSMWNVSHLRAASSNPGLFVLKYLLALWEDLVYWYLLVWFSWAWVKRSHIFLVTLNFSFVNFKALWSFRIIFTVICDEKMMTIDASSLTNTAFIIFILATGCCVDTCLHSVLMVACSSVRVEFSGVIRCTVLLVMSNWFAMKVYQKTSKQNCFKVWCILLSSVQSWQWKPNRLLKCWVVLL